jgi:hypothetical protein
MKWPIALSVFGFGIGMISLALAGTPQPSDPVSSLALPGTTTGAKPEGTPNEKNTDESDDTLYRGKTSETENPMMRDDGPLHFKTRPKEKVHEVESLKKLPSSGSDPKFQSNLLFSGVSSIESVGAQSKGSDDAADEGDPRFKAKRLVFTPEKKDESKQTQSASSPSPTASPTPSPTANNSSKP